MKKGFLIGIIVVVVLVLMIGFFLITKNIQNQNPAGANQNSLNQNTFSSCQASTKTMPFGQGTYTIRIIGIENGKCHWQYSLQLPSLNQTKDCYYPLENMSNVVFNHLFGQDKTGTECSSDVCKQQENLMQTYCK